jgi:hypothetical protein
VGVVGQVQRFFGSVLKEDVQLLLQLFIVKIWEKEKNTSTPERKHTRESPEGGCQSPA